MIDGITSGSNGWAVYSGSLNVSNAANSLLTLSTPLAAGSYNLTFTIIQNYGANHTVGDFSLGYTTAASPTLISTSTLISGLSASSTDASTTFTSQSGGKLLVGGDSPLTATYTILASISPASAITGIFFDVFSDPSLPGSGFGPGREPTNGNFVVSEFTLDDAQVSAVPLPAAFPLFATGLGALGLLGWRRKKKAAAMLAA